MSAIPWGSIISAGASLWSASRQRRDAKRRAAKDLAFKQEQADLLEKQKQAYRDIEFRNPYAGMQNPYAGMENQFADIQNPFAGLQTDFENVYEDLTVNQQQAQFQAEQGRLQRANILQGLRGAAGASGIAGLAQTLANQGTLQAQQISASIGQQETANQRLAARGAAQVQQMEAARARQIAQGAFHADLKRRAGAQAVDLQTRQGAAAVDLQTRQGALAVDMQTRAGDAMLQQAEMSRQATLLGMQMGQSAGANQIYQQSLYNQQQANASANQMMIQGISSLGSIDWGSFGGGGGGGFTPTPSSYNPINIGPVQSSGTF